MAMGLRGEGGGSAIAAHRTTPFMTIDNELDEKKKKMILFLVLRKKERKKNKHAVYIEIKDSIIFCPEYIIVGRNDGC